MQNTDIKKQQNYQSGTILHLILLLTTVLFTSGCDFDWRKQAEINSRQAEKMLTAGNIDAAELLFKKALKYNPYLLSANYGYAKLLYQHHGAYALALGYYRRCLINKAKKQNLETVIKQKVDIMKNIVSGAAEAPEMAFSDLSWASQNSHNLFFVNKCSGDFLFKMQNKRKKLLTIINEWRKTFSYSEPKIIKRIITEKYAILHILGKKGKLIAKKYEIYFIKAKQGEWLLLKYIDLGYKTA